MIKDFKNLTIVDLHNLYVEKKITPLEVVEEVIALLKKDDNNAIEYLMEKEALDMANNIGEVEKDNLLWGIPFAVKDNISIKDVPCTGSSNILKGYVPVYSATVIDKLVAKKAIPVVKSTLDELAMGGTGTSGHLGATFNPFDKSHTHLIGGSSSGSAALTCSGIVPFALGSDTGDSIRKPASYAGLVGFKPTWSRISRYGLFPFAPSLDTIGYFTRSVTDAAVLLDALAGRDDKDSTSSNKPTDDCYKAIGEGAKNNNVVIVKEIIDAIDDKDIIASFNNIVNKLEKDGFNITYAHLDDDLLRSLFPTYFVISCAEATSNNANLDGIKFGPYYDGKTYEDVMMKARTKGFSELIKRRFVFGSFALMRENQQDLFLRAQRNRRRIVDSINKLLSENDFILLPASPTVAPTFENKTDRLSEQYLVADNHLVIANFAGLPSITLPLGVKDKLPYGISVTGKAFEDSKVLRFAKVVEDITSLKGLHAE